MWKIFRKLGWKLGRELPLFAKAFTLPEVVIAISILVMTITTATGILVTVMRTNSDNVNSLVAYGLAQEGIEAVRAMRDSNWFLVLIFQGGTGGEPGSTVWVDDSGALPTESSDAKYFILQKNESVAENCGNKPSQTAFGNACLPFKFIPVETDINADAQAKESDNTQVYKSKSGELVNFIQNPNSTSTPSGFSRFIKIEAKDFCKDMSSSNTTSSSGSSGCSNITSSKYQVTSYVSWNTASGQERKVVLTTELTDWKK